MLLKKWGNCSFLLFWWAKWVNRSGRSQKMSDVSESLRSLTKNERPWAICSHCSEEMSDCERIAQVTHQKWANEGITRFFGQKTSDLLGKSMSELPALEEIHDAGNRNCDPVGILFTEKIVIVVNLIKRNKSTQFGSNPPNLYQIHPICIKSTQFVSNLQICIKSTQFVSNPPNLNQIHPFCQLLMKRNSHRAKRTFYLQEPSWHILVYLLCTV